jgi:hypothetical protein
MQVRAYRKHKWTGEETLQLESGDGASMVYLYDTIGNSIIHVSAGTAGMFSA